MPVIIGAAEYPENVLSELTDKGCCVEALDALSLAEKAGSSKAVNIVLMGKAAKYFDIPYDKWISAIENTVAPKFIEMNKIAFDLGYNA
jgi:indolepyruvate ferredoxin oxidoreductase beta subunit